VAAAPAATGAGVSVTRHLTANGLVSEERDVWNVGLVAVVYPSSSSSSEHKDSGFWFRLIFIFVESRQVLPPRPSSLRHERRELGVAPQNNALAFHFFFFWLSAFSPLFSFLFVAETSRNKKECFFRLTRFL
jgi:hypothetical protein